MSMNIAALHEAWTPISEIATGYANRLIAQGCPDDIAWQMAGEVHRAILEKMIVQEQMKLVPVRETE